MNLAKIWPAGVRLAQGWLVVEAEQDPAAAPPRDAVTRAFRHVQNSWAAGPTSQGV